MAAIGWGEERSRAPGHGESAWAQNRRADLRQLDKWAVNRWPWVASGKICGGIEGSR